MRTPIAAFVAMCLIATAWAPLARAQTQPPAPPPFVCEIDLLIPIKLKIDETKIEKQELSAKAYCTLMKTTWSALGKIVALPDGRKVAFETAGQLAAVFPAPETDWQKIWHELLRNVRHIAVPAGHGARCGFDKEAAQLRDAWFQREIVRRSLQDAPAAFASRYFDVLQAITAGKVEAQAADGTKSRLGNTAPCTDDEKAKVRAAIEARLKP